jgi:peptidyl-prolyl cis-trans isomerase C
MWKSHRAEIHMKVIAIFAVCLGSLWAQVTFPQTNSPKPALPNLPDETVIATFDDGALMTMGQFRSLLAAMPPQNQQLATGRPKDFIEQWALMRKLGQIAEKAKLDQKSPVREQILYGRLIALYAAEMTEALNSVVIENDAIPSYYAANKESFKQVKTGAIYIAFGNSAAGTAGSDGKKVLTQEQAKAKAEKLLASIRAGADFSKLAVENSDDDTSRSKGGFFANLGPTDSIPETIRSAVFALKPGETTEPISQPNGYYLFRAESVSYRPLSEVQDQIYNQLKQERFQKWFSDLRNDTTVQYMNPAFPGGTAPPGVSK